MRRVFCSLGLMVGLALLGGLVVGQGPGPVDADYDADLDLTLLQKYQVANDNKSLLEFVQKRTTSLPDPKLMAELVKQLGDDEYQNREQAYLKLMGFGPAATDLLKQASAGSDDAETKKRATDLLKQIDDQADPLLQNAVIRLIGQRKPKGAAEILLAYLPFVVDDEVAEEIHSTLTKLAMPEGKAEPALVKALKDQLGVKRRAAGLALAWAKAEKERPDLLDLLKDPDMSVRLDIALALLTAMKEKQAIPTLIDVLKDLPVEQLWGAEGALLTLAGDKSPPERLGSDPASRAKANKAWQEWWDKNKGGVDLAKLDAKPADEGQYLVVHQSTMPNPAGFGGSPPRKIAALDKLGKEQWNFVLHNTSPVEVLIPEKGKLAVFEHIAKRLTFRSPDGRIMKEVYFPSQPISAQQLPGGNMLVVFTNRIIEIDKEGKEINGSRFEPPGGASIFRACKPRPNLIVLLTKEGRLHYADPASGQYIKVIQVASVESIYGGLDAKPDGRVLVPAQSLNQVLEYNPLGKIVKRFPMAAPSTAVYLPNGHIFAGSQLTHRAVEFNRQGKNFLANKMEGGVFQVGYK